MPVTTHHHLCTSAVVGHKQNQRVIKGFHCAQLIQHPADGTIHRIHHRGVHSHFVRLKDLLFLGELFPRIWITDLAGAENFVGVRKMIRRPHLGLHGRQRTVDEAEFLLALPTIRANFLPTLPITRAVTLDILGQSVQRKVRRSEGKEMKERFAGMLLLMLLQHRDRVIGNRVGCIKVRANRRSRLTLVIEEMKF